MTYSVMGHFLAHEIAAGVGVAGSDTTLIKQLFLLWMTPRNLGKQGVQFQEASLVLHVWFLPHFRCK